MHDILAPTKNINHVPVNAAFPADAAAISYLHLGVSNVAKPWSLPIKIWNQTFVGV